jgi:hypothetical protein
MTMTDIEFVMACVECGERRAWPEFLCDECEGQGERGQCDNG